MVCKNCGANVGSEYRLCPYCRTELEYPENKTSQQPIIIQNVVSNTNQVNAIPCVTYENHSKKNKFVALVLCIILGVFGGHCFYTGKIGMGILYLFTGGLFCIGWIVDIIRIATGSYKDSKGLPIK